MVSPDTPLAGAQEEGQPELLYESPTTRVFRQRLAGLNVICKEPVGADAGKRLQHEKYIIARLAGAPGVVRLAAGSHPAGALALQDCGATPLAQLLRAGPLELTALLTLAPQLAQAVAAVHNAGVIHLDINPANILLSKDGEPVLIDFNLAVLADQQPGATPADRFVGTLGYMAPEQTGRTGRVVDQRADLYALGATLYEMATGYPPFDGADALQLIHDTLVRRPVSPSQIDPRVPLGLSDIILRLLAKAPEQRYQSAEGLAHDLRRLRGEPAKGPGGPFELGELDFAARLVAPARLVGRDKEMSILRSALAEALWTPRRTVLIEGTVGVGKSALIDELRPLVTAAGGWFVLGKFDQYQKDDARAGAMTQALRSLGRMLLAQPTHEMAALRRRILDKLAPNGGLMIRLLPEFALLLGPQHEPAEVDPRQTELQLHQAAVDLLTAIASPERPIVMVLDDLQWAGSLSLRTLERLMDDQAIRGLLLVGAYRLDDVNAGVVLAPMVRQWRDQPHPPMHLALANLSSDSMRELVAQMLRLGPAPASALAAALYALTQGNPFDTVETINALRRDGVLNLGESGWQWDDEKVRHYIGAGSVVDLLTARIGRLPSHSRELLEYMGCLGNTVECALLCAAAGLDDQEFGQRLQAPLEDGLVVSDQTGGQDSMRFRHDRVQQAVMAAMDGSQRGQRQLAMARRLAAEPAFTADAARQYLACAGQLSEPGEQHRAAQLFYNRAQVLASTASYLLAERYLSAGSALLAAIDEPGDAPLRRAIDTARHCALYSLGRSDESDPVYAALVAQTDDPLDLIEPTCLQMRSLDMRGRADDAMALGRRLLALLGLDVPTDFGAPDIERRLDALAEWVRQDGQIDHSRRTQIRDPRLLGIAKLLGRMVGSAYLRSDLNAFAWLLVESQRLWAEHGPCPELVACMGHMNGMLIGLRQDYRTGFNIARHALAVGEALGYEAQTSEARYRFAGNACAWFEPLENAFEHAKRAYEDLRTRGDASFACYGHTYAYNLLLDIAPNIDIHDAEIEAGLALCHRTGNIHAAAMHTCEQRFVQAMRGRTNAPDSFDDEQFSEQAFMASVGHLPYVQFDFFRGLQALIWGDPTALALHAPGLMSRFKGVAAGYFRVSHVYLFVALANAWQIQKHGHSAENAPSLLAELESCRQWLAARAADQPYNFLHLLLLVDAEQAWATGDLWKAAATFDAAVVEAESRQRPWHRALITERAGLFHLARGLAGTGHYLLAKACDHYQTWGATAKVDQMQRQHVFLLARPQGLSVQVDPHPGPFTRGGSSGVSSDAMDMVGVLRASQALSSETSLEQLTARVTEVLAALSGATKVLVLSWHDEQWWLLAPAPGEPSMPVLRAAELGLLPLSAIGYAERTGEILAVDDAPHDERFERDAYFAGVPLCSLLVVPIAGQGAARAMLLLENRLGRAAFNAQRLDAVMLIAGQLAVSLANAQLYESLEQRVQLRTRELQETQAQLVSTARRAGKAEIANNVLHNVGNVLNSVNVSASVVRRTICDSRVDGLARAVALMNAHERDLGAFVDTDPRGKALLPYLNELVDALRVEQVQALDDLDRLTRSVEHISHVVATQQTHAGLSVMLDNARAQDLVEEALRLSADPISRFGVSVVRRYEDVPATALDGPRVLQILVNIIANGAQAMQGVPEGSRQLTLATSLVRRAAGAEDAERLHISVRDQGEGIAAQNLANIFAHGFTTRKNGHGFGLHASALAAVEMGGRLTVHSDGPGQGAVFTLELPFGAAASPPASP